MAFVKNSTLAKLAAVAAPAVMVDEIMNAVPNVGALKVTKSSTASDTKSTVTKASGGSPGTSHDSTDQVVKLVDAAKLALDVIDKTRVELQHPYHKGHKGKIVLPLMRELAKHSRWKAFDRSVKDDVSKALGQATGLNEAEQILAPLAGVLEFCLGAEVQYEEEKWTVTELHLQTTGNEIVTSLCRTVGKKTEKTEISRPWSKNPGADKEVKKRDIIGKPALVFLGQKIDGKQVTNAWRGSSEIYVHSPALEGKNLNEVFHFDATSKSKSNPTICASIFNA